MGRWTLVTGPTPATVKTELCLGGKSLASFFSYKAMRPSIDPPEGTACHERFRVDLRLRVLYFAFGQGTDWYSASSARGIRCNSEDVSAQIYTPCTSRFFVETFDDRSRRTGSHALARDEVAAALAKSGALAMLDQAAAVEQARAEADAYASYKAAYADATTLEKIVEFERRYSGSDKDSLIAALQPRKRQLLRDQYLMAFDTAKSPSDFTAFITRYAQDDPDGLVPRARQRLAIAQGKERVLREKEAAAKLTEARLARQKAAQNRVASCKRMTSEAFATLERERSIAAVSGVENLAVKRRAGEIIVACQQIIGRGY